MLNHQDEPQYEHEAPGPTPEEVALSATEFPKIPRSELPEPQNPELKAAYLAKLASTEDRHTTGGNHSVKGGFNEHFMREKFCGKFAGNESLDLIAQSFLENNDRFSERFRACGRFEVGNRQELAKALQTVMHYDSPVSIEPEYYYPTRAGGYVLGVGVNGTNRFIDSEDGYKYYGSKKQGTAEHPFPPPAGREDLLKMEERNWGAFYHRAPINPDIKIIERAKDLSVDQKYQLALLYMEAFGAGWTFDEIDKFDEETRILRVAVSRETEQVVCACVADSDEISIEFTEWVTRPGFENGAVMVANTLIYAAENRWPEKTLYGEFRTTSAAATQAFRMGFALPEELNEHPNTSLITGHVKVEGVATDFATLCFAYDFDHEASDLALDEITTPTNYGPVIKRTYGS
jgi:hypothetical protein